MEVIFPALILAPLLSTEFLPALAGFRSTDDRPCAAWVVQQLQSISRQPLPT